MADAAKLSAILDGVEAYYSGDPVDPLVIGVLAKRLGWSPNTVSKYVDILEGKGQLTTRKLGTMRQILRATARRK